MNFHRRVTVLVADLPVDNGAENDNITHDVEPEHQNDDGSERTVNQGIVDRETDDPRKNGAGNGKEQGSDDRSRKNSCVVGAIPLCGVIKEKEHDGGKDDQQNKSKPVPEVGKVQKLDHFDLFQKRSQ